ncbi:MAG: acylphosphatase, partial [Candidatus Micrarchaeia archaeon]
GKVRNMPDGSVEIIASANREKLAEFEKRIVVSFKHGPDVLSIEEHEAEEPISIAAGFEII